jgi:hypothetical protein
MKIVKGLLLAFAIILVITSVVVYFLPNRFIISNSVEINRPAEVVYSQVADFNKWKDWGSWEDASCKMTVEGAAGTQGHKLSWDGKGVGQGAMTLALAEPHEAIVCSDTIEGLFGIVLKEYWRFEGDSGKTKVTWITTGGLKYPIGRLMGLGVEKMLGQPERKGLQNLKKLCEAMPLPAPVAMADSSAAQGSVTAK